MEVQPKKRAVGRSKPTLRKMLAAMVDAHRWKQWQVTAVRLTIGKCYLLLAAYCDVGAFQ